MASSTPEAPETRALSLQDRLNQLAERYAALREEVQRVESDLAATRLGLGLALFRSLETRARQEAQFRGAATASYLAAARRCIRPRRRRRLEVHLERVLSRLGTPGQALIILRSGLWPATGAGWMSHLKSVVGLLRREPNPQAGSPALVDEKWYLRAYPDVAARGVSPLLHYILQGAREGRTPNPLFDPHYYAGAHAEALVATGLSPLAHFVTEGAARGFDPHPLFDIGYYVTQAPELAQTGENPLAHYLREGWRHGLSPHRLFDPDFYRRGLGESEMQMPPLAHYLTEGSAQGRKPHPLFDPDWYREQFPDVAASGVEPLTHYVITGGREGRSPSPWFDVARYLAQRGEVFQSDPLTDYLEGGAWTVDVTAPAFAPLTYFEAHPERAAESLTPLERWASLANLA